MNLPIKYIKAYKLRSLAIIISIVFSIALIVGVGSLNATNNNLELQKMKYKTGIYHAEFKGIDKKQLKIIEQNKNIQQIGLLSLYNSTSKKEKQSIDIMSANNDFILSNTKLVEGRLPKEKDEMIAEAWVLRSLGIEPKVNNKITLNVKNEKNECKNKRNFVMIIASMSICGILFITLDYKLSLSDSRDMELARINHMNADFSVDKYNGVSDKNIKNIKNINGVKNIETCMLMPSKLILNERNILNQKYFDKLNSYVDTKKFDYYFGKDKHTNELILRNNLRGYDDAALGKLEDYKLKGDININEMKDKDIAIVYIPQVNKKNNYMPLPKGESIIDIKPGDKITLKFRKDKVNYYDDKYDKSKDEITEYIYKEFIVGATVSYDYMFEGFSSGFNSVEVIINQDRFKEITGINTYFSTNVNLEKNADYKEVENEILNEISGIKDVQFRNLVQEKESIKSIHNKGEMYNLGINIIIFIIIIVNIINSINHIMICRTGEFATLRAIGLNDISFKNMIRFEGLLYGTIASIFVVLISFIIQKIIYIKSNIIMVGVEFNINYINYIIVVIMNLLLSVMITHLQYKKFKSKSLIECINKVQ